jgi:ACR3 family arsenite efflux pump ArsB
MNKSIFKNIFLLLLFIAVGIFLLYISINITKESGKLTKWFSILLFLFIPLLGIQLSIKSIIKTLKDKKTSQ